MSKKYNLVKRIYGDEKYSLKQIVLEDVTRIRISHEYDDVKKLVDAISQIAQINSATVLLGKLDSKSVITAFDEWFSNQSVIKTKDDGGKYDQAEVDKKYSALKAVLNGWAKTNAAAKEIGGPFIELLMTELTESDADHIASLKSFDLFNGFPSSPFWDQMHDVQRSRVGKCELSLCLLVEGGTVGDDTGVKKDSAGKALEKIVSDVVIRSVGQNCNPKIGKSALGSNDPKKVEQLYSNLFKSFYDKSDALKKIFPMEATFPFNFDRHETYGAYQPAVFAQFIESVASRCRKVFSSISNADATSAAYDIAGLIAHCMCVALTNEFAIKGGSTTSYLLAGANPKVLKKENMLLIVPGTYSVAVTSFTGTRVRFDTRPPSESSSNWVAALNNLSPGDGSQFSLSNLKAIGKLK